MEKDCQFVNKRRKTAEVWKMSESYFLLPFFRHGGWWRGAVERIVNVQ